jgi:hypothetical protein
MIEKAAKTSGKRIGPEIDLAKLEKSFLGEAGNTK